MNEPRMLYKYISFEPFVDLQQRQALCLVLPEIWEDPTEKMIFDNIIDKLNDIYVKIQLEIYKWRTFCQCWTTLEESDAMWRIYSYNNKSIRICAYDSDLLSLDKNLVLKDVTYRDEDIEIPNDLNKNSNDYGKRIGQILLNALSRKRTAFSHEKEVRLIYCDNMDDNGVSVADYYIAYFATIGDKEMIELLCESQHTIDPSDDLQVYQLLNIGNERKICKYVPFTKCHDLIKGVMLHPFAPDWYLEIVKTFCEKNSIPFEGKSKLYT